MSNLAVTEIKAFVPSKNFELSKQFYKDLGFTQASTLMPGPRYQPAELLTTPRVLAEKSILGFPARGWWSERASA